MSGESGYNGDVMQILIAYQIGFGRAGQVGDKVS